MTLYVVSWIPDKNTPSDRPCILGVYSSLDIAKKNVKDQLSNFDEVVINKKEDPFMDEYVYYIDDGAYRIVGQYLDLDDVWLDSQYEDSEIRMGERYIRKEEEEDEEEDFEDDDYDEVEDEDEEENEDNDDYYTIKDGKKYYDLCGILTRLINYIKES